MKETMADSNKAMRSFFVAISLIGTPFFYIPVIGYLALTNSQLWPRLALAIILIETICAIIKLIYPKERPIPMQKHNLYQHYDAASFPSIHSARSAAMAIFLAKINGDLFALLAIGTAFLVGYSRIFLKKHYVPDVIAGLIIGVVISFLTLLYKG